MLDTPSGKRKPLNADNLVAKAREMAEAKIMDARMHGEQQAAIFEIYFQQLIKKG
jgi:vacuolar-type H+-ATPase subunit H